MISVVINSDTRQGYKDEHTKVGKFSNNPLNGTRSLDFLTDGVRNKMNFFRGYDCQCLLYIDQHEELPDELFMEICDLVHSYGNNSKVVCKPHDRTRQRWYDYITLEALKLADGDYVVHFDNDSNAFRSDESDIINQYLTLLESGYKYVCSPVPEGHKGFYWATTQFFICKKETINIQEIERCFDNDYLEAMYGRMSNNPTPCCVEHVLGLQVKEDEVLYPIRDTDSYAIFCWWEYRKGLLKQLNDLPYKEAFEIIKTCGLTQTGW